MATNESTRLFSLSQAQQLLPAVQELTSETVTEFEAVSARLHQIDESHPEHAALMAQLDGLVDAWATQLRELQLEVKGLWLVDFDNGEGYYCWAYPERTISHFHGYEDGFAGRMKIV